MAALQCFITITSKCGKLRCGNNYQDTYCYRWLAASHLFYLCLENALCDNYHTEKLWIPMQHGMVPVVYGGSSYITSCSLIPTLMHLEFPSAGALATHLLYLAIHPSVYL